MPRFFILLNALIVGHGCDGRSRVRGRKRFCGRTKEAHHLAALHDGIDCGMVHTSISMRWSS